MPVIQLDESLVADVDQLGGKAFGIVRLRRLGIPVPPAFVITTDECRRYREAGDVIPADVLGQLPEAMRGLEEETGRKFGGAEHPLLVSVRSGAPVSMPGMMDTILNLGMTDQVEQGLARSSGGERHAADTRRRFERQFEQTVGRQPPADPWDQLTAAIAAVFDSWGSKRAIAYREDRGIPDQIGTAVTVQAMVFGNLDESSGTGVLFSRDPLHGGPEPFGEWLPMGQGEDVVSGVADPQELDALGTAMPDVHQQLLAAAARLERDGGDVQDIEFTVEGGRLWLLQTRSAKRSTEAAVRLAVLLAREGVIEPSDALDRVGPADVAALLGVRVKPTARAAATVLASGHAACPGIVTGTVLTDVGEAERRALDGEDVILARPTTNPEDVHAMAAVRGVVTEHGGATSHAAVVSRELNVACVVGCGERAVTSLQGQTVTVDASKGEVLDGELPIQQVSEHEDPDLLALGEWAREETGGGSESLRALLEARAARRD